MSKPSAFDDVTRGICRLAMQLEAMGQGPLSRVDVGSIEELRLELMSMSRIVTGIQKKPASFMGLPMFEDPRLPPRVVEVKAGDGTVHRFEF